MAEEKGEREGALEMVECGEGADRTAHRAGLKGHTQHWIVTGL